MRYLLGDRLPKFTKQESKLLKGTLDFLGVNYYTTYYVSHTLAATANHSFSSDPQGTLSSYKAGVPIGQPTPLNWLYIYPRGIYHLMMYVKEKYKNPPIYLTENGLADGSNASVPIKEALKDGLRIRYHSLHLTNLLEAIKKGANVVGYYQWSFWDDFEWDAGYTVHFGMVYVDFKDNLKRYLKYSAYWFKMFLLH